VSGLTAGERPFKTSAPPVEKGYFEKKTKQVTFLATVKGVVIRLIERSPIGERTEGKRKRPSPALWESLRFRGRKGEDPASHNFSEKECKRKGEKKKAYFAPDQKKGPRISA